MVRAEAVDQVTRILVDHYQPEQIYLIGSTARGDETAASDLDFLVVLPDSSPREKMTSGDVHQALWPIPFAVDVVPMRRSAFRKRSEWVMSLPAIALREGRLLYDADTVRA